MSAKDIDIDVYIIPPSHMQSGAKAYNQYSYSIQVAGHGLVTLSQKNPNNFDPISGLLYAPVSFPNTNGCPNSTLEIFPRNVTTYNDIPGNVYPVVSVFPWTTPSCVQAMLANSRANAVRGAIVFNTYGGYPPGPSDHSWDLGDGGDWRSNNQFPIYAIPTNVGEEILLNMGLYSGNMSSAPYAGNLLSQYSIDDIPRLGAQIDLDGTSVPSLWTFLIIVLAVLLGLVMSASVVMHFVQRHQRHSLRRRLQRGDVDLESLGIKRMNVPQEQIDAMPMYAFVPKPEDDVVSAASPTGKSTNKTAIKSKTIESSFSQPTCPICLDDFVSGETMVRELPCKHIFHPDCIDPFLRDNSSLCPMCKKSALPAGYCPIQVTNLMVRRERLVRRMRERRRQSIAAAFQAQEPQTGWQKALTWTRNFFRTPTALPPVNRRPSQIGGLTTLSPSNDVELGGTQRSTVEVRRESVMPLEIARQDTNARRAWRREHLARQEQRNYEERAETARRADEGRSWARRALDRVLPGIG